MCEDNMCERGADNKDLDGEIATKVDKFSQEFHEQGLGCGRKIADIAKEIHPDALSVVPLYRSCIVIEQNEEEKKNGACTLHAYADPHWLGGEIDAKTLILDDFHFEFVVRGDRQGPMILRKGLDEDNCDKDNCDKDNCDKDNCDEDEEHKVLEYDEN